MGIIEISSDGVAETGKLNPEKLEQTVFAELSDRAEFKGLPVSCAILSIKDNMVEIGIANKLHDAIVGNYCNYLTQRKFDELMPKLLGEGMRYKLIRSEEASIAAAGRIEINQEVDKQKRAGQCDIVPFPVGDPDRKIELSLRLSDMLYLPLIRLKETFVFMSMKRLITRLVYR